MNSILCTLFVVASILAADAAPPDWHISSANPDHKHHYSFSVDRNVAFRGSSSGCLACKETAPDGMQASFHQVLKADQYRGQRVRVSGYLKATDVGRAGLWFRVDGQHEGHFAALAYANTGANSLVGTADWKRFELVHNIPEAAEVLRFGADLEGRGRVWLDAVEIQVTAPVEPNGPIRPIRLWPREVEDRMKARLQIETPLGQAANLDFEQS